MGTKSDGQVEVDDNGYVMGSSEKGAYFRVHASKSETDHNLGLHIQLVFENGEIRYSTHHENRLLLILFNDTNTETIGFDALKRLPDPPRELPFCLIRLFIFMTTGVLLLNMVTRLLSWRTCHPAFIYRK